MEAKLINDKPLQMKTKQFIARLKRVTNNSKKWYQQIINRKGEYEYLREKKKYQCEDCKKYTPCNCLPF